MLSDVCSLVGIGKKILHNTIRILRLFLKKGGKKDQVSGHNYYSLGENGAAPKNYRIFPDMCQES